MLSILARVRARVCVLAFIHTALANQLNIAQLKSSSCCYKKINKYGVSHTSCVKEQLLTALHEEGRGLFAIKMLLPYLYSIQHHTQHTYTIQHHTNTHAHTRTHTNTRIHTHTQSHTLKHKLYICAHTNGSREVK